MHARTLHRGWLRLKLARWTLRVLRTCLNGRLQATVPCKGEMGIEGGQWCMGPHSPVDVPWCDVPMARCIYRNGFLHMLKGLFFFYGGLYVYVCIQLYALLFIGRAFMQGNK